MCHRERQGAQYVYLYQCSILAVQYANSCLRHDVFVTFCYPSSMIMIHVLFNRLKIHKFFIKNQFQLPYVKKAKDICVIEIVNLQEQIKTDPRLRLYCRALSTFIYVVASHRSFFYLTKKLNVAGNNKTSISRRSRRGC